MCSSRRVGVFRLLNWFVGFDAWLIGRVVQPVLDAFELAPVATARFLLTGAVIARIAASFIHLHVLGTLTWLAFLGDAYRTLPQQRAATRTPHGLYRRAFLVATQVLLDPFLDLSLAGDAVFFVMLLAATAAFYVLDGTDGQRRRTGIRSLRAVWQ